MGVFQKLKREPVAFRAVIYGAVIAVLYGTDQDPGAADHIVTGILAVLGVAEIRAKVTPVE